MRIHVVANYWLEDHKLVHISDDRHNVSGDYQNVAPTILGEFSQLVPGSTRWAFKLTPGVLIYLGSSDIEAMQIALYLLERGEIR